MEQRTATERESNIMEALLEENRRKGFPSEIGSLVRWCKERVGEDYAREFCAAFGITEAEQERAEEYPVMDRKELCSNFETLIHNYEHMGELPHETARRVREWSKDPKLAEQFPAYISFWSEYLLTLSRLVRSEGPTEL